MIVVLATAAWAVFVYSGLLVATFWWVAPPIMFAAISTLVVCNLLEAREPIRPFIALVPPLVSLPYLALQTYSQAEFGLLPVGMLAWPALFASAGYLVFVLVRGHKG